MKRSLQMQKLDEMLRSSKLVAGGFMGSDRRSVHEIVDADKAEVERIGRTLEDIGQRMREISDAAVAGLGTWVTVDEKRRAMASQVKGALTCPWPHPGRFDKTVTTVEFIESGKIVRWSELNIHMIAEHGFFEGKGATFRLEPEELTAVIF
jgi:hypothetical protein